MDGVCGPRGRQRQGYTAVPRAGDAVARRETFDAGLRAHMLKIYNYMASGVMLTGESGHVTGVYEA